MALNPASTTVEPLHLCVTQDSLGKPVKDDLVQVTGPGGHACAPLGRDVSCSTTYLFTVFSCTWLGPEAR
jgi:hypothetical protein